MIYRNTKALVGIIIGTVTLIITIKESERKIAIT